MVSKKRKIIATLAIICSILILYKTFIHYQDNYQIGLARNQFTGQVWLMESAGFHVTSPWVWVAIIDTRPTRVCLTTSARAYRCKLVKFNQTYYQEFVTVEGWRFYWLSNRLSFNFGYDDEYRGLRDILRGHAFGAKKYSFLDVLEENIE